MIGIHCTAQRHNGNGRMRHKLSQERQLFQPKAVYHLLPPHGWRLRPVVPVPAAFPSGMLLYCTWQTVPTVMQRYESQDLLIGKTVQIGRQVSMI